MNKVVLWCAGMLIDILCFAQGIGIEAGGSISSMRATINNKQVDCGIKLGIRAGVIYDDYISDNLTFQYGAFYNAKGSQISYKNTTADNTGATIMQDLRGYVRIDYIELPIAILYNSKNATGRRFFVGGGPYAAIAFGGLLSLDNQVTRINGTVTTKNYRMLFPAFIGPDETDDFSLMDAGLHAQVGFEFPNTSYIRLHSSYGLIDVNPSSSMKMKNHSLGVTIGWYIIR